MIDIRSLEQTLLENLPWNKERIKFVARFLLALYAVRTVLRNPIKSRVKVNNRL